MKSTLVFLAIILLAGTNQSVAGYRSVWEASSGLRPDQINPAYGISKSGNATSILNNSVLTISTGSLSELFEYEHFEPLVDTSVPFFVEARMRLVSSTSSHLARAAASIPLTMTPGVGNSLYIDEGRVFFQNGQLSVGSQAFVDTSAFHTYRIEYDGLGGLALLYDGAPLLSARTFLSNQDNGLTQRILWGDATSLASGVSEWQYVVHNALTVPEPTSWLLFGVGALLVATKLRRRRTTRS